MRTLAVALLTMAALSACGGGGGPTQPAGSIKVTMTEFQFDPASINAPSGKVVFFLVNSGSVAHDLVVTKKSDNSRVGASELVSAGDSSVFTIDNLPAGDYIILCDQPGHEASGMKGTLTVS